MENDNINPSYYRGKIETIDFIEDKGFDETRVGDAVKNPSHYAEGRKYEPWDVIADWNLSFDEGCCVKYISRAGRKAGNSELQDLRKAREFLEHRIKWLEMEEKKCPGTSKI